MIINDFHFKGIMLLPDEAKAELIINPDTMLSYSISFQYFQPVTWRAFQIIQVFCGVQ